MSPRNRPAARNGACLAVALAVLPGALTFASPVQTRVTPPPVPRALSGSPWSVDGEQSGARLGSSLAAAGDVNGDGYADVLVGAPDHDGAAIDAGRVTLHAGSASGPSAAPVLVIQGTQAGERLGAGLATAGDVNGDGYADVLVGAPGRDAAAVDGGRVMLFLGGPAGLAPTPAWTVDGLQPGERLGHAVAPAGDLDGDGLADFLAGAPGFDGALPDEGRVLAWLGASPLPSASWSWSATGAQAGAALGSSVSSAGDVNADGHADVLAGAPGFDGIAADAGRALAWLGSAAGPAPSPAWSFEGGQALERLGASVSWAGDLDGDGHADVAVGAPGYGNGEAREGRALAFRGTPSGLDAADAWQVEGAESAAALGSSVAGVGDTDGDGRADLAVGAPGSLSGAGRILLFSGAGSGLVDPAVVVAEGAHAGAGLGSSVAAAGDVDADGRSDLLAAAPLLSAGEPEEGRVTLHLGAADAPATTPAWESRGTVPFAYHGRCVAAAGDVNGDGYSDILVGAPTHSNGEPNEGRLDLHLGSRTGPGPAPDWSIEGGRPGAQLGTSAATAGDVNGDGYSDVIVGAYGWSDSHPGEGRALLYLGSPGGLSPVAAWTSEGGAERAYMGISVATAGDVNGDGYSDVVVGSYYRDEVRGRVSLWLGSAAGLTAAPSWQLDGWHRRMGLGRSVGSAGDTDADGLSDVLVGAHVDANGESDEGSAHLFLGRSGGLPSAPDWQVESDQAEAHMGFATGWAGDVNGDGYSDALVGVTRWDAALPNAGAARLHLGSAAGPSSLADWVVEGEQVDEYLGHGFGQAGDVNGDGFSDFVVVAPLHDGTSPSGSRIIDAGRVDLWTGSASGPSLVPAWTMASDSNHEELAAATVAGDVNGDGHADVLAGQVGWDDPHLDCGRALLWYGNGSGGLDRIPRQRRSDDSAPIDLLGATSRRDGFAVHVRGRSPLGRDRVRLEVELEPLGASFDGAGLVVGPWTDTGAPRTGGSHVDLAAPSGPVPAGPLRWRARLRSASFLPWTTHWLTMPLNAVTETDLRALDENTPPTCRAGAAVARACEPLLLEGEASDADGDPLAFLWTSSCPGAVFAPSADVSSPVVTLPAACELRCDFALVVRDGRGGECSSSVSVTVRDDVPPEVAPTSAEVACLWPPRHRAQSFGLADFAPVGRDACNPPVTWRLVGCASDQADEGTGDGRTEADCVVSADGSTVAARAERSGRRKEGRTYTVTVVATDACGNESAAVPVGTLHVPHDGGCP